MAFSQVHLTCIEMLLASITPHMGEDGLRTSFMFGPPGEPPWGQHFGTDIYFHDSELVTAALFVRSIGPSYLRSISLNEIKGMLQNFTKDNYWYLFDETWAKRFDGTYAERVSLRTKYILAGAMANSSIFAPSDELTVYPLVALQVVCDFSSPVFSLMTPGSLNSQQLPSGVEEQWIAPLHFPPSASWTGKRETPMSWLGVRSPNPTHSDKLKAAILGAVSLAPPQRYRHMFSGRSNFGGRCTISSDGITTTFGEPHMPPMMHDIIIREIDHPWLKVLREVLSSAQSDDQRAVRALEYFYRGWSLGESERFPILCMALDAVFGDVGQATQALVDAIRRLLGDHIPEERLRLLVKIRASVIHGGAPDVYDSSKYAKYYASYGVDPVRDMEALTARCLQLRIFGDALVTQDDPNAELIERLKREGKLPSRTQGPGILD